jgi:hypothetical protein
MKAAVSLSGTAIRAESSDIESGLSTATAIHRLRDLQGLASWPQVEKAPHDSDCLSRQIDTLVRTVRGGTRVEAYNLAGRVIPRPSELDGAVEVFDRRYGELEKYLTADEFDFEAIWPVPGLAVEHVPLELEPGVVLDVAQGRRKALAAAASGADWPPHWDVHLDVEAKHHQADQQVQVCKRGR